MLRRMKRRMFLLVALALVAASCGGAVEDAGDATTSAPAASETIATEAPETTPTEAMGDDDHSEDTADTTTTTDEPKPEPEGDPAPDFTLALADGSEFSLSAEEKPVYLVFWAEW